VNLSDQLFFRPAGADLALALALAVVLSLPWLNPFALGPTPNVQPLLISWASAALALGLVAVGRASAAVLWRATVWAWVVAAVLSAGMGLLQYLDLAADFAPWVNQGGPGTVFANLRQRNQFATLCAIGVAALAWGAAAHRGPGRGKAIVSVAGLLAAALIGVAWGLTGSRTGLLELVLLWLLALVWRFAAPALGRVWPTLALASLAYLLAASGSLPGLGDGGAAPLARVWEGNAVCASRLTLWANVWQAVMQKPWLGWGWGELGYAQFMTLTTGTRFCDLLDNAHNLPLHLAVTFGLPLAGLLVALVLALVWRGQPWRAAQPGTRLAWAVLGLVGLHSLLEYPLWYGPFQIAVLLAALQLSAGEAVPAQADRVLLRGMRARAVGAVAALVLAGFCWAAAQSYERVSRLYSIEATRAVVFDPFNELQYHDIFLFVNEVAFSRLSMPVQNGRPEDQYALAQQLLHYSAEPRVIERVLESAQLLGRADEVAFYKARYAQAFPERFIEWLAMQPLGVRIPDGSVAPNGPASEPASAVQP
jgi:O-antigen ligase